MLYYLGHAHEIMAKSGPSSRFALLKIEGSDEDDISKKDKSSAQEKNPAKLKKRNKKKQHKDAADVNLSS